jgi:hypothetical protein
MNDKNGSGKWERIGVIMSIIISVMSLSISIVQTSTAYELAHQANELTEKSLELENMLANYTSYIAEESPYDINYAFLGEPSMIGKVDGTVEKTIHYGYLKLNIEVVTPHFGMLTVELKDFNVGDSEMLNPQRKNDTSVSFADENMKYEYVVVSGLNPINVTLHLKALVYPNPQNLPPETQAVQFPIGVQYFKAELYDLQTQKTCATLEFYAMICVVMKLI